MRAEAANRAAARAAADRGGGGEGECMVGGRGKHSGNEGTARG